MAKYYDKNKNHLVCVGREVHEDFCDARWQADDFQSLVKVGARSNKFFVDYTKKYLQRGARLLSIGAS